MVVAVIQSEASLTRVPLVVVSEGNYEGVFGFLIILYYICNHIMYYYIIMKNSNATFYIVFLLYLLYTQRPFTRKLK